MLTVFNTIVGIGTIGVIVLVVVIFAMIFLGETNSKLFQFFKKQAFVFAFLLALGATVGSLIYSEGFHFLPCTFCWWQRIFMYPQVIILGIGAWQKDLKIWLTSIILSVIGGCFSVYHILLQAGLAVPLAACSTSGVSCEKIDVLIFGWITIPIMCLVLFIGILTLAYISHKKTV